MNNFIDELPLKNNEVQELLSIKMNKEEDVSFFYQNLIYL